MPRLFTPIHPHLQNISSDLHELRKWSWAARGEQLLHLLHTSYATGQITRPTASKHWRKNTLGMVGSSLIVLLQISSGFWSWNNCENRLIFDMLRCTQKWFLPFIFGHPVYQSSGQWQGHRRKKARHVYRFASGIDLCLRLKRDHLTSINLFVTTRRIYS